MGHLYNIFNDKAQRFAQKKALVIQGRHYSYADLLRQAERWAACFLDQQKNQRPRVALLTEDPFHTITASLAIARLDGVCIPTNPQMLPEQLLAGWLATDVNIVVYEPVFEHKVKACSRGDMRFISTQHFTRSSDEDAPGAIASSFSWSDQKDFLITLSSGSTSAPKPIVISQEVKAKRAQQTWDLYDLTSDDVVLCASPYFHSLGQRLVFVPLLLGATLVHLTKFTPKNWIYLVKEHQVSFVISVSSHLYALKDFLLSNAPQIRSLKTLVTSSAPIDAHFKDQLFQAVGCDFHEIYGATEVAVVSNLAPKDAKSKYATVGLPCDGVEVKILAETGKEIPNNTIGEIAVKTSLAFEGYYGRPELTQHALQNGYFLTGDLGTIDDEGFLSYVSRKKDVIISGGINIYPKDIEDVLGKHPGILEVSVVGVEDSLLGEVVVAIYVSKISDNIENELRGLANAQLAPFQRPLKYFFVTELPMTASGKVSKMILRQTYNLLNDNWTLPLRMLLYGEASC